MLFSPSHDRPERWLASSDALPKSELEVPFSHILTFLAGPRGCIGYRFALLEIKAILFTLVKDLVRRSHPLHARTPMVTDTLWLFHLRQTFQHIDPVPQYERKSSLVQRPRIKGRESEGYQLLLRVRPYEEK